MMCVCAQSLLTLCDSMDCSLPGSSVHGIFKVRILKWISISSYEVSPQPREVPWVGKSPVHLLHCRRMLF